MGQIDLGWVRAQKIAMNALLMQDRMQSNYPAQSSQT